jgi:hypothetical protein
MKRYFATLSLLILALCCYTGCDQEDKVTKETAVETPEGSTTTRDNHPRMLAGVQRMPRGTFVRRRNPRSSAPTRIRWAHTG